MNVTELVASARDGTESASPYIVSLYGAKLTRFAHLLAADLSEVDREVLCERAIEKAVERIELFDPNRGSFDAWLRGFVRREVYEARRRVVPERLPAMDDIPAVAPSSGESVVPVEVIAALRAAVRRLPETDQLIIALRAYENLPYAAIAEQLGADQTACRVRYHRAVNRLRDAAQSDGVLTRYIEEGP
jgi:RNA polymerase sigma factor (sigma-70 family)